MTHQRAIALIFCAAAPLLAIALHAQQPHTQPILARSLLGEPLHAPTIDPQRRATLEAELAAALADHDADPTNEDAIIWLGRRLAYLHRYDESIKVYSDGLKIHSDSPRLLRHRGHRHITLRDFAAAERDLARAATLVKDQPDEVEPDGQPNTAGIPTSTLQSNIYYHLGLVRYLAGDFAKADEAYRECERVSRTLDMRIATAYWRYLTLRRLDHNDDAATVLASITRDAHVLENHDYHRLLLMFKGELPPQDVLAHAGQPGSVSASTVAYGVGMFHLLRGDDEARRYFIQAREGGMWPAFGYIAAEAELARLRSDTP